MIRIGMVYDRTDPVEVEARRNGRTNYMVPMLLEEALQRRNDVVVYDQDELMAGADKDGNGIYKVDLILNSMPNNGIPFLENYLGLTAWWDLEECSDPKREYYQRCDVIFHPNYNPYRWNLYPKGKTSYLPIANDFFTYKDWDIEKEYDVSFLGRENLDIYDRRTRIINMLNEAGVYTTRGQKPRGFQSSQFISKGKLTIQISGWDNLEERFFQFGAIRPILCDYLEEIDLVAKRDVDYISYVTDEECVEKALYYINHMDEAEVIGQNLIKKLKKYHTYDVRAEEVVRIAKGGAFNTEGQYLWDKAEANKQPTEYPK